VVYERYTSHRFLWKAIEKHRNSIIHLDISVIYFNPFDEIIEELFCQVIDNLNLYSI